MRPAVKSAQDGDCEAAGRILGFSPGRIDLRLRLRRSSTFSMKTASLSGRPLCFVGQCGGPRVQGSGNSC